MKQFDLFISDLQDTCKQHKVKLCLYNDKHIISDGDKFGGWFDYQKRELHCAYLKGSRITKYKELLIHESCHLDQWINQTKAWRVYIENKSGDIVWDYLKGKNVKDIKKHINITKAMEAECENMAVRKIAEYGLDIDVHTYTRKANSYVLLYTYMIDTKRWVDRSPYRFKQIYEQMPSYRIIQDLPMPDELKSLYNRLCYKN